VGAQKREHAVEGRHNRGVIGLVEAVPAAAHRDQVVLDTGPGERRGHHHGLLVWDICVRVSVQQESRRIARGHVLHRAEVGEEARRTPGIAAADLAGPQPLLAAVEVEQLAAAVPLTRRAALAYCAAGFLLAHARLSAVERIGARVPVADNVSIPVERHQGLQARLYAHSGHQRQVASGRMTYRGDAAGIGAEQLRPALPHPGERVLHVLHDRRQLRLRRQSIVYRDDGMAGRQVRLPVRVREIGPPAHDQGPAVDPHDDAVRRPRGRHKHVGADLAVPDRLVGERHG